MEGIVNAKITGTSLGFEDHGIMTTFVHLEWEGSGVGFGGYGLDKWDEKKKERIGTGVGLDFIKRILEVVGVESWEDLKGKYVRVDAGGWGSPVKGIGNILTEEWLYPEEFFKGVNDGKEE